MQIANCTLLLNEFKASVPKHNITPAEAQLLIHMHGENAGEMPIKSLVIQKEGITKSDIEVRKRLAEFYKPFSTDPKAITVEKVFPKGTKLPQTFEEVIDVEGNQVFGKDGALKSAAPVVATLKVDGITYTESDIAAAKKANEALQAKITQLQEQMAKDRQAQIQQQQQQPTGTVTAPSPTTVVAATLPPK